MTPKNVKAAHVFISEYQRLYQKKFGRKPLVNRNKVKYLIIDMLEELEYDDAVSLLSNYVKFDSNPDLLNFCYEYDKILLDLAKEEEDLNHRKMLLRETEERVREFRRSQSHE